MHVYSLCVSECMCISNMIHLWWIKPAVSIEQWPRTPCTGGSRRCKRPLSTELPNIAWPSTDHCDVLSIEVTIGQLCSHNNGITLISSLIIRNYPQEPKLATESPWIKTLENISMTSKDNKIPPQCLYSERGSCCVREKMMTLIQFMKFLISCDIGLVNYTLLNPLF